MEIKKVKLHPVITCHLKDSIKDVAKKMKEKKERRIFVVDSDKKVKGIITSTDLVYKIVASGKHDLAAEEVMSKGVKAIDVKDDINKALEIMNNLETFVCPVLEKGRIKGIISYHDLIKYLTSSLSQ